jgi:hypothetical protein
VRGRTTTASRPGPGTQGDGDVLIARCVKRLREVFALQQASTASTPGRAHLYAPRAGIEPLIGELKHGYGMGQVPTGDFGVNAVMFLLKLLAYNLVQRFMRTQHPSLTSWQIGWLRRVLFRVPGRLCATTAGSRCWCPLPRASPRCSTDRRRAPRERGGKGAVCPRGPKRRRNV